MNFQKTRTFGLLAAFFTVSIWALFLLATRFAVRGEFTVEEVLILRLVPGAILMAPLMFKLDLLPRGQSWPRALILMIGASAIFPYIVSSGLRYAPASDAGALAPGMLPFWAALAAFVFAGESLDKPRAIGLLIILLGAILIGFWQIFSGADNDSWKGHLMFLTGSGLFAIHSVIFRQSGLSPFQGLVIGLFWGTLFLTPILLFTGNVKFENIRLADIIVMGLVQSFIIGILATVLYNYSVKLLGAAETGAFGALTPILALVGGGWLLDETITLINSIGVLLVASGVFLASGIHNRFK
ncbi:MAG: DMT family transporter [Pseudomonadota bacterium]|nr:DMT family transporter [Pseudomonadota bacterium]